jgi:hypothetical protein
MVKPHLPRTILRPWQDTGRRRQILLGVIGILVLVIALLTGICVYLTLSSSGSGYPDRLAEAGDIFSAATLLLTVIAALVALLAYAVTTGLPDLKVQLNFEFSWPNRPKFQAEIDENGWLRALNFKQTSGSISIRNESGYSAKNPAVIVRFRGMAYVDEQNIPSPWVVIDFVNTTGITAVQWDGGATYSIHGNSVRKLPSLNLQRLVKVSDWPDPQIAIELLADGGYRREVVFPVDFTLDGKSQFPQHLDKGREEGWI